MVSKTQAIKALLNAASHKDLADLYNHDMECQVIVAQDNGERIEGEYEGIKWNGYTDGVQTWKPFRIPRNAMSEPVYTDTPMKYDIGAHAEGIGMTGWDWKSRVSKWVAFDFDAIIGHSDKHTHKLTPDELKKVQDVACAIPWVTVRYSTSGKGLHLYVFLDDVPTSNHTEHAALARAILSKLASLTGYDFLSKVDICGGNMWVWHRKMRGTNGLELIKQGEVLSEIPPNWKDHAKIVKGTSKKLTSPTEIAGLVENNDKFDILAGQRNRVPLDEEHIKLIKYLNDSGMYHWWDQDHHMLVTHTMFLKKAHKDLSFRGLFETITKGTSSHNCFCFPMRRGAWSVRRYTPGVKEHQSWDQDGAGWTRSYLNVDPTLRSASHANNGLEDPSGGYHFNKGEDAINTAIALGANITIPPKYSQRPTKVTPHRDGNRLIIEFPYEQHDSSSELEGWLQKGKKWTRIYNAQRVSTLETDSDNYDDLVRHLITGQGEDSGWVINSDEKWIDEPLTHVRAALTSMGLKKPEIESIVGSSVLKPWTLTTIPFESEYPGDRKWNRYAPQFKFVPSKEDVLIYPTWTSILQHVGKGIDDAVAENPWCKRHGILTGANYLKVWISSMIQFPYEPLPYLFIYGDKQDTGKSSFHEALELLFEPGVQNAGETLKNPNGFNGELQGIILCIIEEMNLNNNKQAYERVKDWVTSRKFSLHIKGCTPVMVPNALHFIHCANPRSACPLFPGDTRITMIHVQEKPDVVIPKPLLMRQLQKEASDFLGSITTMDIPDSDSRLRVPVIETSDKLSASQSSRNELLEFIEDQCYRCPGRAIKLSEFYQRFIAWLDPNQRGFWTKNKVSGMMPDWVVKGRLTSDINWHWGNITFTKPLPEDLTGVPYKAIGERLYRTRDEMITI